MAGLFFVFYIAPVISLVWNAVVLILFLKFKKLSKSVSWVKVVVGVILITLGGGLIDFFLYLGILGQISGNLIATALVRKAVIIVPIVSIGIYNYLLGRLFFRWEVKMSRDYGVVMGVLTAPWILFVMSS